MNIFVLDRDIKLCTQYHCDKHVVKMILEYAQLLSSVHRVAGNTVGYELTHKTIHVLFGHASVKKTMTG